MKFNTQNQPDNKTDDTCEVDMICESCGCVGKFIYFYKEGSDQAYNNSKTDTQCPSCGEQDGFEYI